jgi:vacuolar-type H+-ATPase subunit E/Vma4
VYFTINGVKYWIMLTPSGPTLYRREGSKTRYVGRQPLEEVKRILAQAGADVLQKIKSEVEAAKQAAESQMPAQTTQPSQPSLTWKKDGHTYWLLQYGRTLYVYMKGPTTRHKPKLVEKTDISGVIGRLAAAGALHVLEALRLIINGLYAAVADLLKPPAKPQAEKTSSGAQTHSEKTSRKEAEAALKELKRELSTALMRWDEKWRREAGEYDGPPDREWLKERLQEFIDENVHLLEKIQPYEDLLNKFIDAATDAMGDYLFRSDILEILK